VTTRAKPRPDNLDTPATRKVIKWLSAAQVAAFRATHGRIGSTWRIGAGFRKPVPVLLLQHRGRKSGKQFTTPLLYLERASEFIVVASQGGLPENPQWYLNLMASPDVAVEVKRRGVIAVRARTATAAERTRLWPQLVEFYADFADYQSWTPREIPVVILAMR
jgi:deazaflavin-dependent oxidoreductase (nitroreductase family)